MSGGKTTTTTQQQTGNSTVQLPAWMTEAGQQNYAQAAATAAANPITAYTGPRVAGLDANQQRASGTAASAAGAWGQDLDAARAFTAQAAMSPTPQVSAGQVGATGMQAAQQDYMTAGTGMNVNAPRTQATGMTAAQQGTATAGTTPMAQAARQGTATVGAAPTTQGAQQGVANATAAQQAWAAANAAQQGQANTYQAVLQQPGQTPAVRAGQVTASAFDQAAADRYMSPYAGAVRDNTAREMQRQHAIDRASLNDTAQASAAFGGTRHALLEAEQGRNQSALMYDYLDRANADAYGNAQGQFERDRAASMSAQGANQSANLQADTFNTSILDQILARNAAAQTGAAQWNAGAQNTVDSANTDRRQQVGLSNQAAANTALGANADRQQQTSQFNASSANTAYGANADRDQQARLANQQLQGTFSLADQQARNTAFGANADRQQQTGLANQDMQGRMQLADQAAWNASFGANADRSQAAGQFNANAANANSQANADRGLQAGMANQSNRQGYDFANQQAANTAAGANADRMQQSGQFNAAAMNDIGVGNADRAFSASQTNATLQGQMLDRLLASGQQFGNIGTAGSNLSTQDIMNLLKTGGISQDTSQADLDAAYNEFLRMQDAPMDRYRDLASILSGTPRNVSTTSTGSTNGTQKTSGSMLDTLLGVGQLGVAAFSDRRLKRDVALVDRAPSGLGLYRYSYVWDGQDEPPRLGVMADEVADLSPHALGPVLHGFQTVDYAKLQGVFA